MISFEIIDLFDSKNRFNMCFKGGGGKSAPPPPPPAAVPQEAEASAAKRDIEEANLRKRGRGASQKISPAVLLTAPNLNQPTLKQTLG